MPNRNLVLLAFFFLLFTGTERLSAAGKTRERSPSPLSDSLRKVRKTPSPAARQAFREFSRKQGKGWKVRYNPRTALPEALTGGRTARYGGTPEAAATAFLEDNKELLKVEPASLRLTVKKEFLGLTHLQYQQYKDGLPVEFSYARVHISENGEVSGYQGKFEPDIALNTVPAVSADSAVTAASSDLGRRLQVSKTELVLFPDEADGVLKLAWKVRGRGNGLWVYYINAALGTVLLKYDDLRYVCGAYGTSSGSVFPVSPVPDYVSPNSMNVAEYLWAAQATVPLRDQYFWVQDYSSRTVTNAAGDYCTAQSGKIFSSLKGPYFSVTNFRGASAHYDNGLGEWRTAATPINPLSQAGTYSVTLSPSLGSGETFAKVMPRFLSFQAGTLDVDGTVGNDSQVYVRNGADTAGAYIGKRTAPFYGASVENLSYSVTLAPDAAGVSGNFVVDISSYLVLKAASSSVNPGSVLWSTATAGVYLDRSLGDTDAMAEVNAFYQLNAMHRYFDGINLTGAGVAAADLSRQVPVMVHAHGEPDTLSGCGIACQGMMNAYYDLEKDYIVIGDGMMDYNNKYRSFALNGTIVRHEYMHLVTARVYPIINFGEFGAISEGLADYFSLASFWREGYTGQVTLGNFVGAGEGSARDISASGKPTTVRKMPDDWWGEVHEDGLIFAQALYKLHSSTPSNSYDIGTFSNGLFSGRSRADVLTYAAMFYFPDNFSNFYNAMIDACRQFEAKGMDCDATVRGKINSAFTFHGIGPAGLGGTPTRPPAPLPACARATTARNALPT